MKRRRIQELADFLANMTQAERSDFAKRAGTSPEYLYQIAMGHRVASATLAIDIERESKGALHAELFSPKTDWAYIRGTASPKKHHAVTANVTA